LVGLILYIFLAIEVSKCDPSKGCEIYHSHSTRKLEGVLSVQICLYFIIWVLEIYTLPLTYQLRKLLGIFENYGKYKFYGVSVIPSNPSDPHNPPDPPNPPNPPDPPKSYQHS